MGRNYLVQRYELCNVVETAQLTSLLARPLLAEETFHSVIYLVDVGVEINHLLRAKRVEKLKFVRLASIVSKPDLEILVSLDPDSSQHNNRRMLKASRLF